MPIIDKYLNTKISDRLAHIVFNVDERHQERIFKFIDDYREQIAIAIANESEFDVMTELNRIMNQADENRGDLPDGARIQCTRGCAHCCHISVTISEIEAKAIWEHCRRNNIFVNLQYLMEQKDWTDANHHTKQNSACVFLGSNNECKIYSMRPMNCRKHTVISNPMRCDSKRARQKVVFYTNIDQEIIAAGLFNVAKEQGTMPAMLLKTY